jgi:hypothetical protein
MPAGTLVRSFKHLNLDMRCVEEEGVKYVKVELWFGTRFEKKR